MRPSSGRQIRWGAGAALAALALVLVLAFVPDPLFQRRVYRTALDDADALAPGMPVFFSGARIGELRSVALGPDGRVFDVRLALRRAWRPAPCSYVQVVAVNPLTSPRVEVASPAGDARACPGVLAAAACTAVPSPAGRGAGALAGCRRRNDLFQTAQAALDDLAVITRQARGFLADTHGGGAGAVDLRGVIAKATATLNSVQGLTAQLDAELAPGRGDVARTLANARLASDKAARFDLAQVQGLLAKADTTVDQANALVRDNKARIDTLLDEGSTMGGDARALVQALSGQLASTSTSLERSSRNLELLTERLSADPTFALRGQRFRDPPAPAAGPAR